MLKKEELHSLIHSLSKSETRYFKLFCTREKSGKNYLKLFDAVRKQEVYDEKAIKTEFRAEKFVKQLHVTKNYLRQLILKSLRNFHAEISINTKLKDLLHNVEILFNKELYQHCLTELKKANDIAQKYELVAGMVEVENWKRKLEQAIHPQNYGAFLGAIEEQGKAIQLLGNTNTYWQLLIEVSQNMFKNRRLIHEDHSLLNNIEQAHTLEAKVLFYNTVYLQCLQKNDYPKAMQKLQELVELMEAFPLHINEDPSLYTSCVNNYVSFLIFRKNYTNALEMIQKAKKIYEQWRITSENRSLLKQVLRTYNIELEIYRETKNYQETEDFLKSTETFVRLNKHKMPKEYLISFWYQFASIRFMQKDFNGALEWINQLLNYNFKNIGKDLQVQARMLNLMIHLEQENLMVLRYFVDSVKRFLKKVKEIQPYEVILLQFFIKIGRLPFAEYTLAFQELKQLLFPSNGEVIIPDRVLDSIDYREWIDWHLVNK